MRCTVYKSLKKNDAYLYLPEGASLEALPAPLLALFGKAEEVMRLELNQARKLARGDVLAVMQNLRTQGYHLQLPAPEF